MKLNRLAYLPSAARHALPALLLAVVAPLTAATARGNFSPPVDLSPTALAVTANGQTVYIACATAARILIFDVASESVLHVIHTPGSPSGLALSQDESRLYITCAGPASLVCVMDTRAGQILSSTPAGHTALAPV